MKAKKQATRTYEFTDEEIVEKLGLKGRITNIRKIPPSTCGMYGSESKIVNNDGGLEITTVEDLE